MSKFLIRGGYGSVHPYQGRSLLPEFEQEFGADVDGYLQSRSTTIRDRENASTLRAEILTDLQEQAFSKAQELQREKLDKFERSCRRLIREKLLYLDSRTAASIVVGFAPSIYADTEQARDEWQKVVEQEQRLANKRSRTSTKTAVDRRKTYRSAVKGLPPKATGHSGIHLHLTD